MLHLSNRFGEVEALPRFTIQAPKNRGVELIALDAQKGMTPRVRVLELLDKGTLHFQDVTTLFFRIGRMMWFELYQIRTVALHLLDKVAW